MLEKRVLITVVVSVDGGDNWGSGEVLEKRWWWGSCPEDGGDGLIDAACVCRRFGREAWLDMCVGEVLMVVGGDVCRSKMVETGAGERR